MEEPESPQTLYKKRAWHYTVKDRKLGYLCLNCNESSQDIGLFKNQRCPAGPPPEVKAPALLEAKPAEPAPTMPAAAPFIDDAEIAAALQLEEEELGRLHTLEALLAEQQHLEGLLLQLETKVAGSKCKEMEAKKPEPIMQVKPHQVAAEPVVPHAMCHW